MHKKGFSLIELLISLIAISCIMAAMAPIISKKMSSNNIVISQQSMDAINTSTKGQNIEEFLQMLKDCKLNQDKTKLICEVAISQKKQKNNNSKEIEEKTNVIYSPRRDKIRFKTASDSGYKTTSITEEPINQDSQVQFNSQSFNEFNDIVKELFEKSELEIPIEDNNLVIDDYKRY